MPPPLPLPQSSLELKIDELHKKINSLTKLPSLPSMTTYAKATASGAHPSSSSKQPPSSSSPEKNLTKPKHASQFVLHFKGDPPPIPKQISSEETVRLLNLRIIQEGGDIKKVEAITAILKPNGNYVITFTNDIPPQDKIVTKSIIKTALTPQVTPQLKPQSPWTKVIVYNISVTDLFGSPRSIASVTNDLKKNPILQDNEFT